VDNGENGWAQIFTMANQEKVTATKRYTLLHAQKQQTKNTFCDKSALVAATMLCHNASAEFL